LEEISLLGLPAAYYTIKISVQEQSGKELLSQFENFSVTPVASLSRPSLYSRDLPTSNDAWNYFIIGSQYYSQEKYEKAIDEFEKALNKKPGDMSFAISLANAYLVFKRYDDMNRLLVPFLSRENAKYEIYFLLGKAAQAEGSFMEAANYFQNAISHFGLNIQVLNELGECYFKLNNIKEAEAAWAKSLKMYPNQPQIEENLSIIRGKK
jgi:tetratricopeptide (TPR) repeat protein